MYPTVGTWYLRIMHVQWFLPPFPENINQLKGVFHDPNVFLPIYFYCFKFKKLNLSATPLDRERTVIPPPQDFRVQVEANGHL